MAWEIAEGIWIGTLGLVLASWGMILAGIVLGFMGELCSNLYRHFLQPSVDSRSSSSARLY